MNEAFGKILERFILESSSCKVYKLINPNKADVAEFNVYKKCIEIVKEVAEEYNGGWIPCNERLPDDDNYILISFENFSLPIVGRYEEDETGGAFYIGDEDETCISQDLFVNAWQPLPEPYKERDEE